MDSADNAVTSQASSWDQFQRGNFALPRGVGACYVQCSLGLSSKVVAASFIGPSARKQRPFQDDTSVFASHTKIMIRSFRSIRPVIPETCYVDESAQIIGDVVLGEHASVWMNAVLRGDVYAIRIGAHSNVQDCSVLHGMKNQYGVTLGEYVTVGHSVTLHGCVVGDRCLIGMGSIVLNGAKIGAGSIIAAGTLIPERTVVEPGSVWMGSPGKFRRKLDAGEDETIMRYARNYLGYTKEYLRDK
jgi:carbonic anhydrase/acetyltransferase-like protein (isoleucine patch superfamily)